ncbi:MULTISPECIES: protein kinase domain-containing protein [Streptomyces]|uniref:Protein kinase n=2 Tax=Streptomyces TaxID=1883 RepID=A0ABV9J099_9ACTN
MSDPLHSRSRALAYAAAGMEPPAPVPLRRTDPERVGPYVLLSVLGSGGMGLVYLGRNTEGGPGPAAVKVIRPEYAEDPRFRKRFEREVGALGLVQAAHTVRLLGSGDDGGLLWVATEYIPGPTLDDVVEELGSIDAAAAWRLMADVGRAIEAMSRAGIVHRDLKPSNVILAADGARVIDFGIVQAADSTSITTTGQNVGTVAFMSPEQVRGQEVTAASDVFTLASTLTYAVTGSAPFGEGTGVDVLHRVAFDPPREEVLAKVAAADRELAAFVRLCLQKEPELRPAPDVVFRTAIGHQLAAPAGDPPGAGKRAGFAAFPASAAQAGPALPPGRDSSPELSSFSPFGAAPGTDAAPGAASSPAPGVSSTPGPFSPFGTAPEAGSSVGAGASSVPGSFSPFGSSPGSGSSSAVSGALGVPAAQAGAAASSGPGALAPGGPATGPSGSPSVADPATALPRERRRQRRNVVLAAAVAALVTGGLTVALLSRGDTPAAAGPEQTSTPTAAQNPAQPSGPAPDTASATPSATETEPDDGPTASHSATTPALDPKKLDLRATASCLAELASGSHGDCVAALQYLLSGYGLQVTVDGRFGAQTLAAVKVFQTEAGLTADGRVGPETRQLLYSKPRGAVRSGRVTVTESVHSVDVARCLDADTGTAGQTEQTVQVWECTGAPQQKWALYPVPGQAAHYTVVNLGNHRCLESGADGAGQNGNQIHSTRCSGLRAQRWSLGTSGVAGVKTLVSVPDGFCLDAEAATSGQDGQRVQAWSCAGSSNQAWKWG